MYVYFEMFLGSWQPQTTCVFGKLYQKSESEIKIGGYAQFIYESSFEYTNIKLLSFWTFTRPSSDLPQP